jgi:hypothetical protein
MDNLSGPFYGAWSGWVGDLAIFGGIGAFYWHHICHEPGCWRWARHPVAGGTFKICRRHLRRLHGESLTTELIRRLHHLYHPKETL